MEGCGPGMGQAGAPLKRWSLGVGVGVEERPEGWEEIKMNKGGIMGAKQKGAQRK